MKAIAECRLYGFVDTAYLHGRHPAEVARQLCRGGCDILQLRAKNTPLPVIRRMAEEILPVTRDFGVLLVINDYPQMALEVGAPCCHLGQEDFFDAGHRQVSELVPPGASLQVGLSTHAPEQAQRALAAGPAYIAIGPVFATGTKPTARPVTLDYVRWAAAHVPIPWFAIGGITLDNVAQVVAAGARRICVVSAILNAPDIPEACRAFRRALESASRTAPPQA
ncbi:thiamine phosphate synthase [Fontisphaera persica]|uniref:thiamine phosphate synthase n=1 Tax=Fontisphaera persica TaxID=2974023 RepID=UPI0024C0B288|nr:thiamine phosphate synthase [Fontisphaera persica]WCJ58384.1 thiamine phosphate synthase [Fontisphaera persica]